MTSRICSYDDLGDTIENDRKSEHRDKYYTYPMVATNDRICKYFILHWQKSTRNIERYDNLLEVVGSYNIIVVLPTHEAAEDVCGCFTP